MNTTLGQIRVLLKPAIPAVLCPDRLYAPCTKLNLLPEQSDDSNELAANAK
jgi:hypothetical protein